MAILTQIENDLKTALKARDGTTVATVRVLLAEIRNQQIALHGSKDETLKDEHIVALVRQEIKKRREAIQLYQQGKRPELAEKEKKEMEILSKYLPQQISAEELEKVVKQAIKDFKGLEHHLEFVREITGVKFYNDSASTMPQATLAAIRAFQNPVVLILGGVNKGYDLEEFVKELKACRNLKSIILIGKTAPELEKFFNKLNPVFKVVRGAKNISGITRKAKVLSRRGDTILFSPGFASFDMFKNSKDRGGKFKEAILTLQAA